MRKLITAAAVAAAAAAAGLVLAAPASADVATTDCPDTLVLYVGGTKSFTALPWADPEPVNIPQRERYDSIPNSESEEIDYPASIFPFLGWDLWMDDSVAYGTAATKVRIAEQEAKCGAGATQYVVVGYSQGAIVAGDVADSYATTDPEFAKSNINVVTYSDPRQEGGVEDVLDWFKLGDKIEFKGTRSSTPDDFRSYENFCEPGDGVCDMADPAPFWLTRSLFGYLLLHGAYHEDKYAVPSTYVPPVHEAEPVEPVDVEQPTEPAEPVEATEPADVEPVEDEPTETPAPTADPLEPVADEPTTEPADSADTTTEAPAADSPDSVPVVLGQ